MAMAAPGSDRCALHHLEAFTQQRALNRRRRLCGCGAQPDPGYRTCAWCRVWAWWSKRRQRHPALRLDYRTTRFAAGYCDHGNAARAAREAGLGDGSGARRKGYQLLQKPHVRAAIAARSAAVLNHADQRAEDDARAAALAREAEHDRLARLELTARLDRQQRILMRLHHEVMAGGRHRVGSQGGAQSRFARICRQYRGEPAHREPGRCATCAASKSRTCAKSMGSGCSSRFSSALSKARLARLVGEVEGIIDRERDSVLVYRFPGGIEAATLRLGRRQNHALGKPWSCEEDCEPPVILNP